MKTMTVERFRKAPDEALKAARREQVVLTIDGVPVAVLVGVLAEAKVDDRPESDGEGVPLEEDPEEFWRMIQQRRQQPTISWDEAMARLFPDEEEATR